MGVTSCKYIPLCGSGRLVRGQQLYIGGYVIEKVDEKNIKVLYISYIDLKGSIPSFVKNIISRGQGEVVNKTTKVMKKDNY